MPLLSAEAIVVDRPGGGQILTGLDLDLQCGDQMVLLGPNGAGKTTLLRTLAGAQKPSSGRIVLDGVELRHDRRGLREHRRRMQLVLQDPEDQIFSADVLQDVSFGPLNLGLSAAEARDRVDAALELMGISQLADRATHQLSGGERKRVVIAGAVAMRPEVILLDEPTAGLDAVGTDAVLECLDRLHAIGSTMLITTHDVDWAYQWANRAAVLVDGRVQQGSAVEIMADRELMAAAHLRVPWAVQIGEAIGWQQAPRAMDEVVAQLLGQQ